MIYTFIKNNEKIFPIEKMCKVLQVGRVIINGKASLFQRENKELNLLKQNNFHLF
jgi:hypothetical protein